MAMKPCRECKTEISSRAKTCPNCGLKKPHQHPFARGFNSFANSLIAIGLLLTLLLIGFAAIGGDHARVGGEALWAKECYILQAPKTRMWNHRHMRDAGAWTIPAGNVICVKEIDRSTEPPWYKVLVMKMGTLDRSQHIPGWIDGTEIMARGVVVSY